MTRNITAYVMSNVEIKARESLSQEQQTYISNWQHQVFGSQFDTYVWSTPDWHILTCVDKVLVSHVEIHERIVRVAGELLRVGGVAGVATLPEWRGRGFASEALRSVAYFMKHTLCVDFGLLFCEQSQEPFYQRLGWVVVDGPCYFDQPDGRTEETGSIMVLACCNQHWPAGEIDLCGYPW